MAFGNELDDRQLKAIELLATGETIITTAELVGVNRKTITEWKKREKFKAELDRQVSGIKSNVEKKILSNINPLLDKLIKIALKSSSDKISLDAIIYAINRLCGTPTNKIQDLSNDKNNTIDINIDKLLDDVKKDNNIIEISEVKADENKW